jgi:hypothetical protein
VKKAKSSEANAPEILLNTLFQEVRSPFFVPFRWLVANSHFGAIILTGKPHFFRPTVKKKPS